VFKIFFCKKSTDLEKLLSVKYLYWNVNFSYANYIEYKLTEDRKLFTKAWMCLKDIYYIHFF